jgi:hypothetical protein
VKIHDFGLWFCGWPSGKWSTHIPVDVIGFYIYYDRKWLGKQWNRCDLYINNDKPHILVMKNKSPKYQHNFCVIGRLLTFADFEIVPNPNYKGDV